MVTCPRPLAVWTNIHDNGSITNAVENPDGTFWAWASPGEMTTPIADYFEDGAENAKRTANSGYGDQGDRRPSGSSKKK